MKAIVKSHTGPGVERKNVPTPDVGDGQVLIRVTATSICGTDYHIYRWDAWAASRFKPPKIMGHEVTGEVVEVGKGVTTVAPGDRVAAESHIACGRCFQCRIGKQHVCENLAILGVDVDGSFAEYVVIPEQNAWKIGPSIPAEVASIFEPLGNAVHATLVTDVSAASIAIFGCGPTGLSAVQVARASGASPVLAVEINPYRVELAKKAGATLALNPQQSDVVAEILQATGGRGVDVVLEMSGSPQAVRQSFRVIRNGGRVSLFGIPSEPVQLNIAEDIIFKETRVVGTIGREMFRTWYKMEALLRSGLLDPAAIITHRMPLEDFDKAMELMRSGSCGKIVLFP